MKPLIRLRLMKINKLIFGVYFVVVFVYLGYNYSAGLSVIENALILFLEKTLLSVLVFPINGILVLSIYEISELVIVRSEKRNKIIFSRVLSYMLLTAVFLFLNYLAINILGVISRVTDLISNEVHKEFMVGIMAYSVCFSSPLSALFCSFLYSWIGFFTISLIIDIIRNFVGKTYIMPILGVLYLMMLIYNAGKLGYMDYNMLSLQMVIPSIENAIMIFGIEVMIIIGYFVFYLIKRK